MRGYKYSINEEVAHIHNLGLKMIVTKLLWRTTDAFEGQAGEVKKVKKRKFDGCMCQWWQGPELKEKQFHAEVLVPFWVAVKGPAEAEKWLDQMKYDKHVIKSKG